MCGRYVLNTNSISLKQRYKTDQMIGIEWGEDKPLYNIAPGSYLPTISQPYQNEQNIIEYMKWGLIPHWAKNPKIGYKLINTRSETIDIKPSFKSSFINKRCLIPATGFYEWKKEGGSKTPYLVFLKSREIFSMAGIYDIWADPEGHITKSFSIITINSMEKMKIIHDRMPLMFEGEDAENTWLNINTSMQTLKQMLNPGEVSTDKIEYYPVSDLVNSPANDNPAVLEKISV